MSFYPQLDYQWIGPLVQCVNFLHFFWLSNTVLFRGSWLSSNGRGSGCSDDCGSSCSSDCGNGCEWFGNESGEFSTKCFISNYFILTKLKNNGKIEKYIGLNFAKNYFYVKVTGLNKFR